MTKAWSFPLLRGGRAKPAEIADQVRNDAGEIEKTAVWANKFGRVLISFFKPKKKLSKIL
jgi:hypothetical protein